MLISDVISVLESFAPLAYQESYDNSGLQIGQAANTLTGALLTLDITEAVIDEAIARKCNLIIAHHPLIFSGLKRLTGSNYVERAVLKAIRHDIALYAAHTNMDNARQGVNAVIAGKLGLQRTRVLQPMRDTLRKLYTYVPEAAAGVVRDALFAAGAGAIGDYSECSFNMDGEGTFRPGAATNPAIGTAGGQREQVREIKIEVLVQRHQESRILQALFAAHPYEEVAYELIKLENTHPYLGAGLIGALPAPMPANDFLHLLKTSMKATCIRHTALPGRPVQKIAVCGGAGSFLLKDALRAGADVFITADYKYHQFFDADGRIVIADIGHYESEQFTTELFAHLLKEKIPNFAPLLSDINTNPVNYFL